MRILVVEDLIADAALLREALADAGLGDAVVHARDGREALAYLRGATALPQLVLLDLDLPGISGRDVLELIRGDPRLRALPVVVLSTSGAPHDVAFAYGHLANAYVRKPLGFEALAVVARSVRDFWIRTATLPSPFPVP